MAYLMRNLSTIQILRFPANEPLQLVNYCPFSDKKVLFPNRFNLQSGRRWGIPRFIVKVEVCLPTEFYRRTRKVFFPIADGKDSRQIGETGFLPSFINSN